MTYDLVTKLTTGTYIDFDKLNITSPQIWDEKCRHL